MSRLLRVVLVLGQCLILLGFPAAPVYAADLNAEAIATGLRDFGLRLNDIGSFGALSEALPLTNLSPSADEVLRLHRLFGDTLTAGLAPSYTSLAALASAIDGLDGIYGGVAVAFESVTVAVNGTNSDLIDVGFSVTATRAVTLPISFSDSAVSLNGGGIPLNLQLNTSLNFQLDKTKVVSEPALAFYLVGEPTISLSAQAGGPVGTFHPC